MDSLEWSKNLKKEVASPANNIDVENIEIYKNQKEIKGDEKNYVIEKNKIDINPEEMAENQEMIKNEIYQILDLKDEPNIPKKENKNEIEIEIINDKEYRIIYAPKEDIYPAYGYGGGRTATVRQDLSPRVKKFVKAHELYHCQDESEWGGWIGSELRANLIPGLKDPVGLALTIWKTITDKDRINFYLDRIKRKY
jgi:hypothetical protein